MNISINPNLIILKPAEKCRAVSLHFCILIHFSYHPKENNSNVANYCVNAIVNTVVFIYIHIYTFSKGFLPNLNRY